MTDLVIVAIVLLIVGTAIAYIIKAKKSGAKCIGCPVEGGCPHKTREASSCNCGCHIDEK